MYIVDRIVYFGKNSHKDGLPVCLETLGITMVQKLPINKLCGQLFLKKMVGKQLIPPPPSPENCLPAANWFAFSDSRITPTVVYSVT